MTALLSEGTAASAGLHIAWAEALLDAFAGAGVTDVVASPGSRSTPLLLAALRDPRLHVHDVVDERSAAFFALGASRVTGRPSLLLCTSGTAGAHYLPALIEASMSFVPLIALTADRPFEHAACGAPQTIDQVKLFGDQVRGFFELGAPDAHPDSIPGMRRAAAQAVALARGPLPGPVHLNARFRKPLEPLAPLSGASQPQASGTRVFTGRVIPDPAGIAELAAACARSRRGLIACGPAALDQASARAAIEHLAAITGFPLFAESASQLRHGPPAAGVVRIDSFDALLRAPAFRRRHSPDLLIQIGALPVSDGWAKLVEENPGVPRWIVAEHGWPDPTGTATGILRAEPGAIANAIAAALGPNDPARGDEWARRFVEADAAVRRLVNEELDRATPFFEGHAARAVFSRIPSISLLMHGNSLSIRDADAWCPGGPSPLPVLHQRGANGIDGLVSGAAGAATVAGKPVTLVLGDVSFLHDLGGLASARDVEVPLVIVVVDNRGGRIFERLPLASIAGDETLSHWITPHPLDFAHVAPLYGVRFARARSERALCAAIEEAHRRNGCTVISAEVAPSEGTVRARRLQSAIDLMAVGLCPEPRQGRPGPILERS